MEEGSRAQSHTHIPVQERGLGMPQAQLPRAPGRLAPVLTFNISKNLHLKAHSLIHCAADFGEGNNQKLHFLSFPYQQAVFLQETGKHCACTL